MAHDQASDQPHDQAHSRPSPGTSNELSGGVVIGPVVLGRDISVELPAVVPSALNGLRPGTPEFVGQDGILRELLDLLDPGREGPGVARVSAVAGLAGLAGVGKTELALQAAHRALAQGWYPGGALMVDLHGYEPAPQRLDAYQALGGLLRALSVPGEYIPPEAQDRERLYRAIMAEYAKQGRPILVVIDNASAGDQAAPLLPGSGGAIVTSRHTLASLDGRLLDLDVLSTADSITLLARLLRLKRGAADTRVANDPESARRVAGLCAGLPLAVEIIAALLAALPAKPLDQMALDLAAERTRLEELAYEQTAVRAAFDLSYRRLDDGQARLFRLLTVNPGPEVSTAAAAILADLPERRARQALDELARAHLIEPGTIYGRWRLHDLVRLYATDLGQAGAEQDGRAMARARLFEHYLVTSWTAATHLNSTIADPTAHGFDSRERALEWLDAEVPNLVAATRVTIEDVPSAGIVMARSLARYLSWRRHFGELISLSTLALDTARRIGDRHNEGMVLNQLAAALAEVREFEEAITTCQDAIAIHREMGERISEANALGNMASVLRSVGRSGAAVNASQRAIAAFREMGDRHGEARAISSLGDALRDVGRFEEAITASQDAMALFRKMGDAYGEATAIGKMGITLHVMQRFDEAIAVYQEVIAVFRQAGDRHSEAQTLYALAASLAETERFEEAISAAQEAVASFRETGDRHGEATAMHGLGIGFAQVGRLTEAISTYLDAAETYHESDDRVAAIGAMASLAEVLRQAIRETPPGTQ
jgi:tetratricopeptide (TPR) repeat protein